MNNTSQCIFDISHVVRNLRDTLELVLPNEQDVKIFDQRKSILTSITDPKSFLGKFIEDNKDKLEEFKKKYQEFLDDVYGDASQICTKTSEGKVRVDHAQNQKIFEHVIYLSETLRDILYSHIQFAKNKGEYEELVSKLVDSEEKFDRVLKSFLLIQEYQKSFMEFQKVMNESQGKPTPQSNYIVQNELTKIGAMIRFVRGHAHCIDNKTLDVLDANVQIVEMSEGRRERRDNKSFPDLYKANHEALANLVNEYAPDYQGKYEVALKEMLDAIKTKSNNGEGAKA